MVPEARERVKPSPAGTVNPLMLTVVQDDAAETSLRELMVAVQAAFAPVARRAESRRDNILSEET